MSSMPKGLTASTGMDALTHAIEDYTTKGAWEMTDMFHLKAMGVKGVDDMSVEEYKKAAINAVQQLSVDVGIPTKLEAIKSVKLCNIAINRLPYHMDTAVFYCHTPKCTSNAFLA